MVKLKNKKIKIITFTHEFIVILPQYVRTCNKNNNNNNNNLFSAEPKEEKYKK